jgi:Tol biopolymer transport system component
MSLQFVTYASHYEWSPDGQHFLVTRGLTPIYVVEADGNNERILTYEHTNPQWAMDGEWIYAHTLENSQSSLDRIHITTNRSEELFRHRGNYSLPMSLSPDGTHLVTRIPTYHGDELYLMTADGSEAHQIPVDLPPPTLDNIRWSPDSTWIAFSGLDVSAMHIYRIRPDGSDLEHLSDAIEGPFDLHWSPNGEWLLLGIGSYGDSTIARLRADGTSMEILGPGFSPQYAPLSGLDWRPFWLMSVAALMFLASFTIRFRS